MKEDMKSYIDRNMDLYFEMDDNKHVLTDNNKMLLAQLQTTMAMLPENSKKRTIINQRLQTQDQTQHTDINNTQDLPIISMEPTRKLVPSKQSAGFINVAILVYGMINIGIILAIAIMK